VLDPFVRVGDRVRHQVADRWTAGTRRQLSGDLAGGLGAAKCPGGDLDNSGAEFAEHAASAKCLAAFDNRRVTTVDLDRVRDHVAAARERLAAANIGYCQLYEALKPVVGSHDRIDQAGSKGKSSRWLDEDVIDINVFLRRRPQA
jgi:hypothetical protein